MDKALASRGSFSMNARGQIGLIAKIALLGLLNALALWGVAVLARDRQYVLLVSLVLGVAALDLIYLSKRAYPLRFILPGTVFLVFMVIFPIAYTVYVSFTNMGTGHILSKEQAIEQYSDRFMIREDLPTYRAEIFRRDDGDFAIILTAADGAKLVASAGTAVPADQTRLKPIDADNDGTIDRLGSYERVSVLSIFSQLGKLQNLAFAYRGTLLKMRSSQEFASYMPQYKYDSARDAIIDLLSGTVYYARDGSFTARGGKTLDIGYRAVIGWRNFKILATDRRYASPFLRVFCWTVIFAAVSVLEAFALGLLLAILLNDPRLRLRGLYRVLLIVPYALPAFITCLIWRGLFQTETGMINNALIVPLFGRAIPWLSDPFWAKTVLLVVNLWLGFPYMMLICSGALQSVPGDLYEAAMADGATGWQQFRRITLPLILAALAPLLIAGFAFNFNNFNVIYLVTGGLPAIPGSQISTGATDILISYTYRMAFESGSGGNYGLGATVSLLIFLLVGAITLFSFRYTKALEEVPNNE